MSEVSDQLTFLIEETLIRAEISGVPKDEAFYLLGNTLSSVGEFEQALKAYSIAIKENERKPEYYHNQMSALKRKICQDTYQVIEFNSIKEKEYIKKYKETWGSYPKDFITKYSTEVDRNKKFREAVKKRYLVDVIPAYLTFSLCFPDYGRFNLSLANTYIEVDEYQKAVKSYYEFIQAYEEGKFIFNPIVGGSNQEIKGSSELETIILTSINYLEPSNQHSCLAAFRQAYSLHIEKTFWLSYANHGRAFVINQGKFQSFLQLISIDLKDIKIPEHISNEVRQKILSEWHKDRLDSREGQFWQIYSQGGYELVRTQNGFKGYLEFINVKKENIYIPNYLPDEIQQKILSNWEREKLNSCEGQFWQIYSQGGYELVRTQDKFKDYLEFINYNCSTLTISNWVPNNLKVKIRTQWQQEKQQIEHKNGQDSFKRLLCLGGCYLAGLAALFMLSHIFTESALSSRQESRSVSPTDLTQESSQ